MAHTNNVFEIYSKKSLNRSGEECPTEDASIINSSDANNEDDDISVQNDTANNLHLKGQMMYMLEWDSVMFLATPVMDSLDDMFKAGLYINDLSMHDSSRDLVLAGTQQSAELKLALDQEQEKSRLLEQSMQKLDVEMKRTDALLYQMIPKPVADRLRKGEPSVNTCEVFDNVTILFSDVVGFTTICSKITPMEVVSMLNAMYTNFDKLSEKHKVYKVETIGDAYMGVSGAPIKTKFHALYVCDMALDMVESMKDLTDPSTGQNMKIRVGIHSGTAVAGVVGIKMPRYCLFGDTVNTASRMETNGEAMKIHISEITKNSLTNYPYTYTERGSIELKGKGSMKTYWLLSKNEDGIDNYPPKCPFTAVFEDMDTLDVGDDIEDGRVSSRTMYSPVSFEDVSKNIVGSPHGSPISKNTPTKHTTDLKTVHSNPSHHISCLQDTDGHIVKDANGDLTASKYIGSPPNCPYSSHSSYSEKRNRQSSLVKRNSIILPTPFNLSTPVKQNNILNNNDKMSCPLAIDEPLSKSEFVKETQESPTKNKEVNQMIKNELRAPPKTSKPTYGEGVKKEGSEKPKSQTCTVL